MKCDCVIELQGIFTSNGTDECRGMAGYKWYGQKDVPNRARMPHCQRGDPREHVQTQQVEIDTEHVSWYIWYPLYPT